MRKNKLLTKPTRSEDLNYEDFSEDIASDWRERAERLQIRRWRKIKHQLI